MIINAPLKKSLTLVSLLLEELKGDDKEFIETLMPTIKSDDPELDEEVVDELIRVIRARRKERAIGG